MASKLSTMLKKHQSSQNDGEIIPAFTPDAFKPDASMRKIDNLPATVEEGDNLMQGFDVPEFTGQSVVELQDEVGPQFLHACFHASNRALTGQVNVLKEGVLPHKIALLLVHKLMPSRKVNEKRPQETPAQNKKTARALSSLIKSLTTDGEIVIDAGQREAA